MNSFVPTRVIFQQQPQQTITIESSVVQMARALSSYTYVLIVSSVLLVATSLLLLAKYLATSLKLYPQGSNWGS